MTPRSDSLFEVLEMVATIGMTWWVSATVLCATIIGGTWVKRKDLRGFRRPARTGYFLLVACFLVSVILFGVVLVITTSEIGSALSDACRVSAVNGGCLPGDALALSNNMRLGFLIGTSSFVVTAAAWIGAWWLIARTSK